MCITFFLPTARQLFLIGITFGTVLVFGAICLCLRRVRRARAKSHFSVGDVPVVDTARGTERKSEVVETKTEIDSTPITFIEEDNHENSSGDLDGELDKPTVLPEAESAHVKSSSKPYLRRGRSRVRTD